MRTTNVFRRRARTLASTALMLSTLVAASRKARADEPTDQYRFFDLAARKVPITKLTAEQLAGATITKIETWDGSNSKEVTAECHLKVDAGAVVPNAGECVPLWNKDDPETMLLTINSPKYQGRLQLQRAKAVKLSRDFAQPKSPVLVVRNVPQANQAAIFVPGTSKPGEWITVTIKDRQITLDANPWQRLKSADDHKLAILVAGGEYTVVDLHRNEAANAPAEVDLPRPEQGELDCAKAVKDRGYPLGSSPVYCVDTIPGQQLTMASLPASNLVVPPNQTIYIVVRTWDDDVPSVTMTGTVGLSDRSLNNATPKAQSGGPETVEPEKHTSYITVWPFAPRTTATATTVTVKIVKRADRSVTIDQLPFDLAVDTVYYGALRLGIALGVGQFDHGYQAQKVGGSSVSEVVATANTTMNMELVVGFSPYLDGLFSGNLRGRSYGGGWNVGVAPYFGIGILSQSNKNLDAFRSFHLGGELELGKNFSIAVTYVGRFVNALPGGVAVGSPVPDGTLSTNAKLASGAAVVLNIAPEFFKFAANGIK